MNIHSGSGAIITHAPQAPYFGPIGATNAWVGASGGYTAVYQQAASYISFFNVQFYNQGASCYIDYNGLFKSSAGCSGFASTSVNEIANAGVPLSKIVVGKPVTTADASNGWDGGSSLASFFSQAKSELGWNAGVMGWVWNDAPTCTSWIQAIYGSGGGAGVTVATVASATTAATQAAATTTTSSTSSASTTGGSGSCAGKSPGWYCMGTGFAYCSGGAGTVQQCAAGTHCTQVDATDIACAGN